jgi:hypothetical protein
MLMVQKKSGLWSDILLSKVTDKNNSCFIRRKDIHFMNIAIIPIVKAFEEIQSKKLEDKGNTAGIHTPLDQEKPNLLNQPEQHIPSYSRKERSKK